jgi:hypothetical protein
MKAYVAIVVEIHVYVTFGIGWRSVVSFTLVTLVP